MAFYATITARKIRLMPAVRTTLRVLLDTDGELNGLQIRDRTGLRTGTIYPFLDRLPGTGWITSRQEDQRTWPDRNLPGRRLRTRRTYHALTPDGRKAALHELPPQHNAAGP